MKNKKRIIIITVAVILGLIALLYLCGMLSQLLGNYAEWNEQGGFTGGETIRPVNWDPLVCVPKAFTANGLKGLLGILIIGALVFAVVKLHDRFDSKDRDPRGFARSGSGAYGTASWMSDKEMKETLEIAQPAQAEGIILGEYKGKAVCLPKDTRLNRHIAVFGASGTMKSRAVIRNALFQALKQGESVVITDPKGELYADTAELYRESGYEVKVFNLVNPEHGDSWNCMSDLHGDTLMAQVLTNVIIGNTSAGKGDHFWDNGEGNLLKALVLYIDQDKTRSTDNKHLPAVYQLLTRNSEHQLTALFDKLPLNHPARAPYNLFAQASDTVRSGIILGLGTRLTVRKTIAVAQLIPQYRHNEGQGKRKLLTPDEILRLPPEELLCIIRGCNILKLIKLDYTKHPMAERIRKASVFDYTPREIQSEQPEEKKAEQSLVKSKKLYGSAKPPSGF